MSSAKDADETTIDRVETGRSLTEIATRLMVVVATVLLLSCGSDVAESGSSCETGACSGTCGDGACDPGEDCASCEFDCGKCADECGNASCVAPENCASCSADCGDCKDVEAGSCQQSEVEAALQKAAPGDTVAVPAGDCDWTGLALSQAVHLRGAGSGLTNITVLDNNVTKQPTGVIRISGFSFEKHGGSEASKGFRIDGSWREAEPIIFENNEFTISDSGLFWLGVAGGLIVANNSFTGGWDDSFIQFTGGVDSDNSWGLADTMGVKDANGKLNHYVEDNTFYGGTNQGIDVDGGGRVVYRHNTLTYSSFNTHGLATSKSGVRHFEIYDNTFIHDGGTEAIASQNWAVWIRGGTGVIFNNQIADLAGSHWGDKSEIRLTIRGAEDARPQGDCASVSYPVPHQLGQSHNGTSDTTDPIHIWGNTGTVVVDASWAWGNPCGFDWATFFQWGRDAINDETAKPGYAAYAYPHPLVSP